jgi:hypothetical protein
MRLYFLKINAMKTEPNETVYPLLESRETFGESLFVDQFTTGGLTKREYFAASQDISKEVQQMVGKNPDPTRLSRLTGVPHPKFGTNETPAVESEWDGFWFDVEAALKVMKADALINALNKTQQ